MPTQVRLFTSITPPLAGTGGYVSCIAVDPDSTDDIVVVYSTSRWHSIFRS